MYKRQTPCSSRSSQSSYITTNIPSPVQPTYLMASSPSQTDDRSSSRRTTLSREESPEPSTRPPPLGTSDEYNRSKLYCNKLHDAISTVLLICESTGEDDFFFSNHTDCNADESTSEESAGPPYIVDDTKESRQTNNHEGKGE